MKKLLTVLAIIISFSLNACQPGNNVAINEAPVGRTYRKSD